jgi:hypothetical protein
MRFARKILLRVIEEDVAMMLAAEQDPTRRGMVWPQPHSWLWHIYGPGPAKHKYPDVPAAVARLQELADKQRRDIEELSKLIREPSAPTATGIPLCGSNYLKG